MRRDHLPIRSGILVLTILGAGARAEDRPAEEFFEATIRPILVEKCGSCHDDDGPKGGLSLTSRGAILAGGDSGPAAESGEPGASLLVEVVRYDSEPRMPPGGKLSDGEIEALTRWIELGLPWPGSDAGTPPQQEGRGGMAVDRGDHWAFRPVEEVEPPGVEDEDRVRTPIDRFVISRLEAEGLGLSPEADRRILIRRLSFDLTGLPPTPEDADAFVADESPDAYDRLVDRLLDSPHHGEHWARHWLDVARYSDTKGYVYAREESSWVHARAYRDWVVRSLNEDMPYDRFLLLQVAADQAADEPEDLAAMGFLTLGRRFLGVKHDIIDDRIDVVSRGMLGLTVACARCHDHKYDPIPTSDYYALYGVFRNSEEALVPAVGESRWAAADEAFLAELETRQAALRGRLSAERGAASGRVRGRVEDYLLAQFSPEKYPGEAFSQILTAADLIPASVHRWREAIDRGERLGDPVLRAWIDYARIPPDEFRGRAEQVHRSLADAPPSVVNPAVAAAFPSPPASREEVARRYGAVFRDVIACWERRIEEAKSEGTPPPDRLPDPDLEAIRRLLYGEASPCEVPDEALVNIEFFFPTSTVVELWQLQGEVDRWLIRSPEAPPHALILADRDPEAMIEPRVFRRGNAANPGEVVPRRSLRVLSGPDDGPFRLGSGRLELARSIVDPTNPLTARVAVNRAWMHHFGAGLVDSPGDFGTRAGSPSHPELLDWLAARFVAEGWSLKWLHREIVRSATYRQAAAGPADLERSERASRLDPENRLLWRMPVHRLSFEELRDALLAASGRLDRRIGGPSGPLFGPSEAARRTLYGTVDRQELPTVLRVFDFANPDLLIPQRSATSVPQQALFFLNHPFMRTCARALVDRDEVAKAANDEERVRRLYRAVYQREPTPAQIGSAIALVRASAAEPEVGPPPTAGDWSYGYGRFEESSGRVTNFRPLPFFSGEGWQGGPSWPDPGLGWARLTAEGGHPGNDRDHAVIRRWVAPSDGRIRVESTVTHDVARGDGIRAFLCGGRHGLIRSVEVHDDRASIGVESLQVRAGDVIDFVVDLRDGLDSDQFRWAPVITGLGTGGATTWDARDDFAGDSTPTLGPWEQLAQVLLMSNEFSFVE
ncbi:PSD1 and planctomycete cytochrome C domain-containing protein [Tautonia plasticadhaerens]|uniref:Planctomycete cytochrome C n=1 Tax=Tautonia plasticadhaerens TaxID=2527974 RepID=A0A518GVG3_9BACT|nr:PSD1 and planctomycete cytochrome C domain-containing protein [Tautonia plasticadhaerens]QDV32574.1 Planctomycete cytochrome C [Tautonia plasticadhaerens]